MIWWVLISFQLLYYYMNVNRNSSEIDFFKIDLELELFWIDTFQKSIQMRVYCPTCLRWSYALHNIVPESIVLTVNT